MKNPIMPMTVIPPATERPMMEPVPRPLLALDAAAVAEAEADDDESPSEFV
jgi:hypothetical protein